MSHRGKSELGSALDGRQGCSSSSSLCYVNDVQTKCTRESYLLDVVSVREDGDEHAQVGKATAIWGQCSSSSGENHCHLVQDAQVGKTTAVVARHSLHTDACTPKPPLTGHGEASHHKEKKEQIEDGDELQQDERRDEGKGKGDTTSRRVDPLERQKQHKDKDPTGNTKNTGPYTLSLVELVAPPAAVMRPQCTKIHAATQCKSVGCDAFAYFQCKMCNAFFCHACSWPCTVCNEKHCRECKTHCWKKVNYVVKKSGQSYWSQCRVWMKGRMNLTSPVQQQRLP